jgi:hypothetical protein
MMSRTKVLQEVRQMWFEELYERRQRRDVTMAEAAEILGVTDRSRHHSSLGKRAPDSLGESSPSRKE